MIRSRRNVAGFTLIELFVVMVIVAVLAVVGLPALDKMMSRAKTITTANQVAALMRRARLESIKRGLPVEVGATVATGGKSTELYLYFKPDGTSGTFNSATDKKLDTFLLPRGVILAGPGTNTGGNATAIVGFSENGAGDSGYAVFQSDGSVVLTGAFRVRDSRQNIVEIRVDPQGTARIAVQKYNSVRGGGGYSVGDPYGADDTTNYFANQGDKLTKWKWL